MKLEDVVDLDLYPAVTSPAEHLASISEFRTNFQNKGLLSLPGFIRSEALQELIQQSNEQAKQAYFNSLTGNAYLEKEDMGFPEGHPKRMTETTSLGVVANDQLPEDCMLKFLYNDLTFQKFVECLLDRGSLYKYDCNLGALNLSVMKSGDYLRWHFDQSDFVVSLNIQEAEKGGAYEYVSNLRSDTEANYEGVKSVLEGDRSNVEVLSTPPGSLILFEGRYTLHRVTEIGGTVNRYTGLFGYGLEPGIRSSDYLKNIRYGRI